MTIRIAFCGADKNFVRVPYIASAYIARNTAYYGTYDAETGQISTIFSEPYDEAYKIVYEIDRE